MRRPVIDRLLRQSLWIVLFLLTVMAIPGPVSASPLPGTCFAVQNPLRGNLPPGDVRCAGTPNGYEHATLWLRLPIESPSFAGNPALLIHSTRFDRLGVLFLFADGSTETYEVRRGAFGNHWHFGGQIEFQADLRTTPLTAIWLRIDHLKRYDLLRIRLVPAGLVTRQFELCAALIGAAIALLATTALYNFALAAAVRRCLFLWHGLWATMMVCWGMVWSQGALLFFPGIGGTISSRLLTPLAGLAIFFAMLSAISDMQDVLSRKKRFAIVGAGLAVVVLSGWSTIPSVDLHLVGNGLAILTLSILGAIGSGLVIGYRRGDPGARGLLFAWTAPMMVLASTQILDFSTSLLGGGAQIAVLFTSALQTICLSTLATHRLGILRVERDAAIASEAALTELAERDALTGLLNRRGFVRRCETAFGDLHHVPFGLLLVDVDRFKRVNDQFGHEVGDAVLVKLGVRLQELEKSHACLAGRLGGEEFVVGVSGIPEYELRQFADDVRERLYYNDSAFGSHNLDVTVSIGVSCGTGSGPFAVLYGEADRALYRAKADGRNRVVLNTQSAKYL